MIVDKFIRTIDAVSTWSGKVFAWLIGVLMLVISVEVFKRYILNAPTAWIFDLDAMLDGTLFMMCGAYTRTRGPRLVEPAAVERVAVTLLAAHALRVAAPRAQ